MKKYVLLCTTLMSMSFVSVAHADTQQDKINNLSHLAPAEKTKFIVEAAKANNKTKIINVATKLNDAKKADELQKTEDERARVAKEEKEAQEKAEQERLNNLKPLQVFEVTAKYESNNRNPGAVLGELDDGAGMNYGTYSLTQNHTMKPYLEFLSNQYPELRAKLTGEIGSEEFNQSWKQLGQTDTDIFKQSQAQFIFEKYSIPTIEKLNAETGVNLLDGTHSLGAVGLVSGMIHNAGKAWYPVIRDAANEVKASGSFDDNTFIEKIGGWVRDNYSGVYKNSIRNRYRKQTPDEQARTEIFTYTKKTN